MRASLICCAALLAAPGLPPAAASASEADAARAVEEKGVRIEFEIGATRAGTPSSALMEGELAEVRFRVTDAQTGAPVSPLEPAVWISRTRDTEELTCRDRIGRYLQGMLSFQAEVDLNKYFILVLNNDQTISVVDPLLGVNGITQLYAMVMLPDTGEDWTRGPDERRLFVSMPEAGEVAVVDLDSFKVTASVEAGGRPVRLALQPDGRYLWVGDDATAGGVTVLDPRSLEVAGSLRTGAGHHEIAFSDDSLFAFVSNPEARTVSVVDTQRLEAVGEVALGATPVSLAYTEQGEALYAADADGILSVVVPDPWRVVRTVSTRPGLADFRFAPGGRWGFAANASENRVDVVDASRAAVVRTLEVESEPHQLAFTDTYAYVRHLGTPDVTLIPLSQLAGEAPLGIQKIAFGSKPPGADPRRATADAISPTGEWTAVVAANPADRLVYYYMEGMIAPMGSYTTYGRIPRAVSIVDRSVRETEKGVYTASFRVPAAGDYNVALVIDSPFIDHCFAFSAVPDPSVAERARRRPLELEFLTTERTAGVGSAHRVVFSLRRALDETPVDDPGVAVLATRPPGGWRERLSAEPLGDGRYSVEIPVGEPGAYYVSVAVPSFGAGFTELPYFTFRGVAPAPPAGRTEH